jgi:hypothetical protein
LPPHRRLGDLDEVKALGFQSTAAHISVSHAYVHMVDFGLPVKVGGLWVKPGDLIHADQHGAVNVPLDIAAKIPEAVAKVEAAERQIIAVCQSRDFTADKLKELFKKIRPGTYVAKTLDTPSTKPRDRLLVAVATILIGSFLPSLWVIHTYSSSRSISSHIARAAGFSVLTLFVILFVVVYMAVHSPK